MSRQDLTDSATKFMNDVRDGLKPLTRREKQIFLNGIHLAINSYHSLANPVLLTPFEKERFMSSARSNVYSTVHELHLNHSLMEKDLDDSAKGVAAHYKLAATIQEMSLGVPLDFEEQMELGNMLGSCDIIKRKLEANKSNHRVVATVPTSHFTVIVANVIVGQFEDFPEAFKLFYTKVNEMLESPVMRFPNEKDCRIEYKLKGITCPVYFEDLKVLATEIGILRGPYLADPMPILSPEDKLSVSQCFYRSLRQKLDAGVEPYSEDDTQQDPLPSKQCIDQDC